MINKKNLVDLVVYLSIGVLVYSILNGIDLILPIKVVLAITTLQVIFAFASNDCGKTPASRIGSLLGLCIFIFASSYIFFNAETFSAILKGVFYDNHRFHEVVPSSQERTGLLALYCGWLSAAWLARTK